MAGVCDDLGPARDQHAVAILASGPSCAGDVHMTAGGRDRGGAGQMDAVNRVASGVALSRQPDVACTTGQGGTAQGDAMTKGAVARSMARPIARRAPTQSDVATQAVDARAGVHHDGACAAGIQVAVEHHIEFALRGRDGGVGRQHDVVVRLELQRGVTAR